MLRDSRRQTFLSFVKDQSTRKSKTIVVGHEKSVENKFCSSTILAKVITKLQTSQINRIKAKTPQPISCMFNNYFTSVFNEVYPSVDATSQESISIRRSRPRNMDLVGENLV